RLQPKQAIRGNLSSSALAISADRKLVAGVGRNTTIWLWELARWDKVTGEGRRSPASLPEKIESLAFAPTGKQLAVGCTDHSIRLFDLGTGKEIACCKGHSAPPRSLAFSPDGALLASCGLDKTIRLWDPSTGKERTCIEGRTGPLYAV